MYGQPPPSAVGLPLVGVEQGFRVLLMRLSWLIEGNAGDRGVIKTAGGPGEMGGAGGGPLFLLSGVKCPSMFSVMAVHGRPAQLHLG